MQQLPGPVGGDAPAPVPQGPDLLTIVLLTAALVGLVLFAAVAVALARRFLLERPRGSDEGILDTARLLAQYERLRAEGQLTEEEYQRIRATVLGQGTKRSDTELSNSAGGAVEAEGDSSGSPPR